MITWRRYARYRREDGKVYDTWYTEGIDQTILSPDGQAWRLVTVTMATYRNAADARAALDAVAPGAQFLGEVQ